MSATGGWLAASWIGPIPAADEVVIKVFTASANPIDAKMREAKYPFVTEEDLADVIGCDISGKVQSDLASGRKCQDFQLIDVVNALPV